MKLSLPFSPPGHRRSVLLRRVAAAALVVAAVVSAVASRLDSDPPVVVFAHPLPVGSEVGADDLRLSPFPATLIPEGAATDMSAVVGRVVVTGVGAGEVVTDSRLTGPRLTEELAAGFSPDQDPVVVPVKLADPATTALLRHGDTVTIVTTGETAALGPDAGRDPRPDAGPVPGIVVATGGRVVIADPAQPETILVALEAGQAQRTASASLSTPLGIVVTGDS